ncbi:transposase family protein [Rhodococcus zopfii]
MSPLAQSASCPECESVSRRIHSRYGRTLADASIGNRASRLVLRVRRILCPSTECSRRTFAEQIEGLTSACSRHTPLLRVSRRSSHRRAGNPPLSWDRRMATGSASGRSSRRTRRRAGRRAPESGCGGDTLWSSMTAAYDALPETMKNVVDGLEACTIGKGNRPASSAKKRTAKHGTRKHAGSVRSIRPNPRCREPRTAALRCPWPRRFPRPSPARIRCRCCRRPSAAASRWRRRWGSARSRAGGARSHAHRGRGPVARGRIPAACRTASTSSRGVTRP